MTMVAGVLMSALELSIGGISYLQQSPDVIGDQSIFNGFCTQKMKQ